MQMMQCCKTVPSCFTCPSLTYWCAVKLSHRFITPVAATGSSALITI